MALKSLPPVSNKESFRVLPTGLYILELIELDEAEPSKYEPGVPRALWKYTVDEVVDFTPEFDEDEELDAEDLAGEELWEWTSQKMGKKANMRKRVEALLGRELEDGEEVDPGDLPGRKLKANVEKERKESGDGYFAKVVSVQPYRTKGKKTGKPKAAPPPVDDDDDEDPF